MRSPRFFHCALLALSLGSMLACGSANHTPAPVVTDIYAAGFEVNNANLTVAKYWKNGQPVVLGAGANGSFAISIAVSGNDVYVAGIEGNGTNDVAKYWKNGAPVELTDGTQRGFANSIFVSGTDVYVAGGEQTGAGLVVAKYWESGVAVVLPDLGEGSLAQSIFVSGSNIYVAGWVQKTTQIDPTHFLHTQVAAYWKNGVRVELTDGTALAVANSMFVAGTDIYVAGLACQNQTPGCTLATYWKNGVPVQLTNVTDTEASSVFVSGADVYVAGNQTNNLAQL